MSYTILYDTQFVRSRAGITPCVLAGDNNVYETAQRRARDWSCFLNLAGVPAEDILERTETLVAAGYEEYYRRTNGKSMDGTGLLRWVRSGIKNAAYLEDILMANNRASIHCYISVWRGNSNSREMDEWISSTTDFDLWLSDLKLFCEEFEKTKHNGDCVFPVVTLWERMVHPKPVKAVPSVIKGRLGYFCGIETSTGGYSTVWSNKVENAIVVQPDEIDTYVEKIRNAGTKKVRILDAKVVERAKNAVSVIFAKNNATGTSGFVVQVTSKRMRYHGAIEYAHRYFTDAAATVAIERLSKRFPDWSFEVRRAA